MDPFNTEDNLLIEPHRNHRGSNNADGIGRRAFAAVAKLWTPRNASNELPASTVSRYTMRLIDRATGKAYSADELVSGASVRTAIASDPAAARESMGLPNGTTVREFSRILAVGDSIVGAIGSSTTIWNQHFMTVANALLLARTSPILTSAGIACYASSGSPSNSIKWLFLDRAAASAAHAVLILAGTNDYPTGRTAAQVAATLGEMVDTLLAAGKTPIVCDVLPLPSGQAAKSAWIVQLWAETAAVMATRPAAIHVQWASALDSNLDGVADLSTDFSDTVHPNSGGHYKLGVALAAALSPYVENRDYFEGVEWLSPGPTMPGTPGPGTATGWNVDQGTGKTVTSTLIARSGALGNWQQLAITGDAAVNSFFRYGFGTASGGWAVGDEVEFVFEFETDNNLSALFQVGPSFQTTISGSTAQRVNGFGGVAGTNVQLSRMAAGVIVSPRYTIPANTTAVWPYISILGTGTIRIGRVGIRRTRPT